MRCVTLPGKTLMRSRWGVLPTLKTWEHASLLSILSLEDGTSVVEYDCKEGKTVSSCNPECRGRHAEHVTSITDDTSNNGVGFRRRIVESLTCTDRRC
jgi:hypothetical protein